MHRLYLDPSMEGFYGDFVSTVASLNLSFVLHGEGSTSPWDPLSDPGAVLAGILIQKKKEHPPPHPDDHFPNSRLPNFQN